MAWSTDPAGDVSMDELSLGRRIQWLLLFRLLFAGLFLLLTLAVQGRRGWDLLAYELSPLYFFSVVLFLYTLGAGLALKRLRRHRQLAYVQLTTDALAVTALIFISGGFDSPFSFLYAPVIISGAVLLYRRGSMIAASMCSLLYGGLLDLQYFGFLEPLQIVSDAARLRDSGPFFVSILMAVGGFYLVAFLAGYMAEELQKSSREVMAQRRDFRDLERLHKNIVHSMNSGLLTIGTDGRILFANRAAERILEVECAQLEGTPLREIFPKVELDYLDFGDTKADSAEIAASARRETVYVSPSRGDIHLGYAVSLLQSEDEEPAGRLFMFQDLTHLKRMEGNVQRMERLAFAGKVAAEIAHEIKNPLAAMSGAVQMLQDELREDPVRSRLMGIVEREISRINELVIDFLWLARGRKPAKSQEVSVCAVTRDILMLLEAQHKIDDSHTILTDFDDVPPVRMDGDHFRQMMWNLLVNALESMPEGGDLSVGIRCESDCNGRECIRVDVGDTGPGFSEEDRQRIFEPFYTTKETGTGLGLSIACQLAETAGGRIEVGSHNGLGTVFSIFLPLPDSAAA